MEMSSIMSIYIKLIFIFLICFSFAGNVKALSIYDTVIPAAACTPKDSEDSKKIKLSNLSWVFSGASTGTATLLCPVAVAFPYNTTVNLYRIYYTDPDGKSNYATNSNQFGFAVFTGYNISSRLFRLEYSDNSDRWPHSGSYSPSEVDNSYWNSSTHGDRHITTASGVRLINHTNEFNQHGYTPTLYTFEIKMHRNHMFGTPSFSGISFLRDTGYAG